MVVEDSGQFSVLYLPPSPESSLTRTTEPAHRKQREEAPREVPAQVHMEVATVTVDLGALPFRLLRYEH